MIEPGALPYPPLAPTLIVEVERDRANVGQVLMSIQSENEEVRCSAGLLPFF